MNLIKCMVRIVVVWVVVVVVVVFIVGCYGLLQKQDEMVIWLNNKLYLEVQDVLFGGDWGKCVKYFELL